jgi:hypothetical protein
MIDMKKRNIYVIALALLGVGVSSCRKEFDPKSYAPPLVINGFTSSSEIEKANLAAYYSFNGNLVDSVSGTAGEATGTAFTKGEVGQGLQGALNGYVLAEPGPKVKALNSFTISEWVNTPPPSTGIIGIFSLARTDQFWGNIEIFIENGSDNTNGKVRVHIDKGGSDYTYAVDGVLNLFNVWKNITVTYDSVTGTCALYVNGSKVNTGTAGNLKGDLNFTNIGKLVFGTVQFNTDPSQTSATGKQDWASYLTGQMDEVRIYDKVLSDNEIGALVALQGRGK